MWMPTLYRNLLVAAGSCKTKHDSTNNMATGTTAKGKTMGVIAASGGDFVHHDADKPTVKSSTTKLHMGIVPGVWNRMDNSLACRHARLNNEERAMTQPTQRQRTAQTITGPKYFSPRLVEVTYNAEHDLDDKHVVTPAGGCAAKIPQNVDGIDATSRVFDHASPLVLFPALESRSGGQCQREDRNERCCLVRRWRLNYDAHAPATHNSKHKSITTEEHDRNWSNVHMACKPAKQTIEVDGGCNDEHPLLSIPDGEIVGPRPLHDAWPSQLLQEQLPTGGLDPACQKASSPNCPDVFAHIPNLTSESAAETLQNGPVVMESERCSYLLNSGRGW